MTLLRGFIAALRLPAPLCCILFAISATAAHAQQAQPQQGQATGQIAYPFQNPNLPTEQRIDNLISLMTLDEKIACLSTFTRVPRLGISGTSHMEGLHGLSIGGPRLAGFLRNPPPPPPPAAGQTAGAAGQGAGAAAGGFRRFFSPITTTQFPQAIGMAETWDPDILRQAAHIEGYESRFIAQSPKYNRSSLIVMAPNADLGRDPRWGRTEECYGEDPFFNGTMVTAYVRGLQGADPKYWLTASLLKHFLANSNEDTRSSSSSDFDDRLLREYYSVAFRMGIVDGGARAFMAAYNSYNGIPCGVNPILKSIAVDEWGEDGIICTDGGAVGQMVTAHHYFADTPHAFAATLHAGITKYLERQTDGINAALEQNLITQADIDKAIRPNFRILIKLGLLDPPELSPYSKIGTDPSEPAPWTTDATKAVVRQMTRESIVLLKNSRGLLPLDKSRIRSIAVIGPRADDVLIDWYGGLPPYKVTPLDGIRAKAGPGMEVTYAADNTGNAAARLARAADVAIVVVGNHPDGGENSKWGQVEVPSEGREAVDRKSIDLEQEALIKQVYAANPNTIVVLISSFPYAINWSQAHVPAIVHMTQSSQETGNALADVLFGDYNPAGRLVQTWPVSLAQIPTLMDYNIRHGRTYMYFNGKPLYPFGYGLSYTRFAYSNLLSQASAGRDLVTVKLRVKNTGQRAGDEVVQLYAQYPQSAVVRPKEQLVGFQRVKDILPGETRAVTLTVKNSELAYWSVAKHKFVVESGKPARLLAGSSSADLPLATTIATP